MDRIDHSKVRYDQVRLKRWSIGIAQEYLNVAIIITRHNVVQPVIVPVNHRKDACTRTAVQ